MPSFRKSALVATVALPIAVGGFVLQERATRDGARLFDQVLMLVSDRFVDTVDASALYEKAARGLVQQLNDPYSELFTPKQLQRFSTTSTGRYGGIGMQIEDQQGNITVVRVFPHTPAEGAGIQEGDRIIGVDTQVTRGWTTSQVSDALMGQPGTKVRVRFARPGVAQPIEQNFTRATIHIPAVPFTLILDGKVGYIPLQTFNETATDELEAGLNKLLKDGARGFIIDIRGNPGGILDQGLAVADLFLDNGEEIASVRGRQGAVQRFAARGRDVIPEVPLVVLTDGYSASASEIVAGALQDHDRALVVGTTSFGKGLVQTVFNLDGGYALKMTTAKWFTPSGRSIQKERKAENVASSTAAGTPPVAEDVPDSLETESVKKSRPAYRSDAGRVVYGGGGITPDVIIAEDTATTPEQEFAKAIAPKAPLARAALYDLGLDLKGKVQPNFTVPSQWREDYFRRLTSAGVQIDRKQYEAAAPLVDRWISGMVARLAFGDSTAFRRSIPEDPQLTRAIDLLKRGTTQKDLFAVARASR